MINLSVENSSSVCSDALAPGLQYVLEACEKIKQTAHVDVDVEVDFFHSTTDRDANSSFKHVVLKISPRGSEAQDRAILFSSHINNVFSEEGDGDHGSSIVAAMLELARGLSQIDIKNSVIFFFNVKKNDELNAANSYITEYSLTNTVATDLDDIGIEGISALFQGLFTSGFIAYGANNTDNDKTKISNSDALKKIGVNMLAFMVKPPSTSQPSKPKVTGVDEKK